MLESLAIKLDDLPPEGRELELDIPAADLAALVAAEGEASPAIISPLKGALHVKRRGARRLALKGQFQVTVEAVCDRCLKETHTVLDGDINEAVELKPAAEASPGDGSLAETDGGVDLSALVAEYFWLSWPWHFLCKPDCQGLCPRCGADLNDGPCGCAA